MKDGVGLHRQVVNGEVLGAVGDRGLQRNFPILDSLVGEAGNQIQAPHGDGGRVQVVNGLMHVG
jgi:hypothetical protein